MDQSEPSATKPIDNKSLTQSFEETRYAELTAENWRSFVDQGLSRNFFNNFHAKIPGGYQRNFYEEQIRAGEAADDNSPGPSYATIEETIKELGAQQLLTRENPRDRLSTVTSKPFDQLSESQRQFFDQFIALYQKLREKGFAHWDLVG